MNAISFRPHAILILLLMLTLAACTGNRQATTRNTEIVRQSRDPVTVDFWHTFNDEESETLKAALSGLKQEAPHISVNLQQVPFSDALNKYKTVAQAGNAPDIFRAEIAWTTELASMGYLMSLDAFLDSKAQQDFLPQSLAYSRYQGHLWGVPQVTDCLALFYNKRLVGATAPATQTDFIKQAQTLTHGKQYGFFYRGDPYWFTPFIWAFGGDLIDSTSLQVKIAEPPAVNALQFLIDLRKKYKVVPESVDFANDYENMQIGFKNGQYAMIINGPWSTADLLAGPEFKNPDNLGIARIPSGPGGWGSPVGGHNYVIAANTRKLWAAWEVIEYLSRPDIQARFALKNNLLPTRKSTYALSQVRSNRIITAFRHVLDAASTRPVIPQSGAIFIDLKPAYQAALLGEKSPQTALKEVEEAWKQLLSTE